MRYQLSLCACIAVQSLIAVNHCQADAPATQPASQQQLTEQMSQMQSQMQKMQTDLTKTQAELQQTQAQLQQQQLQQNQELAERTKIAQQMLDDASKHSALLSDTSILGAGFDIDRGFYIESQDGQSLFHPGVLFDGQQPWDMTRGKAALPTGVVQFDVDGSVLSKDLTYDFQINLGAGPTLESAYLQYIFLHTAGGYDIGFIGGRYKDPMFKESGIIADSSQLFIERSLADDLIGGGEFGQQIKALGLVLLGDNQPIHASVSISHGTNFASTGAQNADFGISNLGISARADYKFFGDWVDTTDMSGKNSGKHDLFDVGGGATYANSSTAQTFRMSVDGQYQMARKLAAFAAVFYDHYDFSTFAKSRNDVGVVVQAGYSITNSFQVVARQSLTNLDSNYPAFGHLDFWETGAGVNYYFGPDGSWGNHAKVALDINYLPNGAPANAVLYPASNRSEFVMRGEFQLWF